VAKGGRKEYVENGGEKEVKTSDEKGKLRKMVSKLNLRFS
jgi:hypothetical protein